MKKSLFFYSDIIGFIGVYFYVAYAKKYIKTSKLNLKMLLLGMTGWISMMMLTNIIGLHFPLLDNQCYRWNSYLNPFLLIIAFALFNMIRQYKFFNKWINYISSTSLLVYIIHCNRLYRDYVRWDIMDSVWNEYFSNYVVLQTIVIAFITLIVSFAIAVVYKLTFGKVVGWLSDRFLVVTLPMYRKIERILLHLAKEN